MCELTTVNQPWCVHFEVRRFLLDVPQLCSRLLQVSPSCCCISTERCIQMLFNCYCHFCWCSLLQNATDSWRCDAFLSLCHPNNYELSFHRNPDSVWATQFRQPSVCLPSPVYYKTPSSSLSSTLVGDQSLHHQHFGHHHVVNNHCVLEVTPHLLFSWWYFSSVGLFTTIPRVLLAMGGSGYIPQSH